MHPLYQVQEKSKFNDWLTGPPCFVQATGKQRKEIIEIEFNTKAKAKTREREANINYDSSPETSLPKKARPAQKPCTEEDDKEADEVNIEEQRSSRFNFGREQEGAKEAQQHTKEYIDPAVSKPVGDEDFLNELFSEARCREPERDLNKTNSR